jgi:hypothetical protein
MKGFHFSKKGFSLILRKLSGNWAAKFFPLFYGNFFSNAHYRLGVISLANVSVSKLKTRCETFIALYRFLINLTC